MWRWARPVAGAGRRPSASHVALPWRERDRVFVSERLFAGDVAVLADGAGTARESARTAAPAGTRPPSATRSSAHSDALALSRFAGRATPGFRPARPEPMSAGSALLSSGRWASVTVAVDGARQAAIRSTGAGSPAPARAKTRGGASCSPSSFPTQSASPTAAHWPSGGRPPAWSRPFESSERRSATRTWSQSPNNAAQRLLGSHGAAIAFAYDLHPEDAVGWLADVRVACRPNSECEHGTCVRRIDNAIIPKARR